MAVSSSADHEMVSSTWLAQKWRSYFAHRTKCLTNLLAEGLYPVRQSNLCLESGELHTVRLTTTTPTQAQPRRLDLESRAGGPTAVAVAGVEGRGGGALNAQEI